MFKGGLGAAANGGHDVPWGLSCFFVFCSGGLTIGAIVLIIPVLYVRYV